ncbi:hypothetical protein DE146DRAFT_647349 [Phaeosphaeria sp. MPI-PUGE-AT-0046c]|nr:hypothetical protein DE146DRAFT_647349 [Phaeosphaeria sp. MPI-PUGE-AT-0046c]
MVSFRNLLACALAISGDIALGATVPAKDVSIVKRGRADIVKEILKAIGVFTNDNVYTWNFKKFPQYCEVYMETRDGGHCYATVECKEGGKQYYKKDYGGWDNCKVGGENKFDDPRIGSFSIGFKKRDGSEGEGLTNPVIIHWDSSPFWYLGSGPPVKIYDVSTLALQYRNANMCEAGIAPINCDNGPFVCRYVDWDVWSNRKKKWACGIPVKGDHSLDSLELPPA